MNIWIDLSNSPHVLFFAPIVRELERRGHDLLLTNRDFAQTSKLCKIFGLNAQCIGKHGGQGVWKKIKNISGRAYELRNFAKNRKFDLALSHNSYAHCLAAKSLGIRYITIMDYEHQPANHINFRLADKILTPFTFRLSEIKKYGATPNKLIKFPGLKEDVYLWTFQRNPDFWRQEYPELDASKVMCTIRPPATMAAYHNFKNPFFDQIVEHLLGIPEAQPIFFPRTHEQGNEYHRKFPNLFISKKSVDGAQLIANSDLVISAGGTMNREAAVLGTPAYTVFSGKMGSVDRHLMQEGNIRFLNRADDFKSLKIQKKRFSGKPVDRTVFDTVVNIIENEGISSQSNP